MTKYVCSLAYDEDMVPQRAYNRVQYIILKIVPRICYYFVLCPTNAQLSHKLSYCYMFRHYRIILGEFIVNTLPSYTSISNSAVGNTIYN